MEIIRVWPSATTLLLAIAACASGTALFTHAPDGFHPLVIEACMLPAPGCWIGVGDHCGVFATTLPLDRFEFSHG